MAEEKQGMRWRVTKAVRASKLPSPSKLIMLTLADIADVGTAEIPENWTPSLTVLTRETSLSRSAVTAHLRALESAGWIVRMRPTTADALGRGERTRYRLCIPSDLVQEADHPSAASGLPSAGGGQHLVQEADHPSAGAGHRVRSSSDLDQISSDPSPSSAKPPKAEVAIPERPDVEQICRHLADRIEANGSKRPTITKTWRDAARRLIDRDGKTVEQIMRAIDWCQDDEFWHANILSMPTLREKYDRLQLAARRKNGHRPPTNGQDIDWNAAMERAKAREGIES